MRRALSSCWCQTFDVGVWCPALVALDPEYAGDEEAFCEGYAAGDYAASL